MNAKLKIAVTGSNGQLGWHICTWLKFHFGHDVVRIDREKFNNASELTKLLSDCDAVVHAAGMNRGTDNEVERTNLDLANKLSDGLEGAGLSPHLVYVSSVQIERDNPYGRGKKRAGELLHASSERAGCPYTELVLPNLFGEFSRPDYNNFTGTFCARLAAGERLPIDNPGSPVELMHYGEVARLINACIQEKTIGTIRPKGHLTTVGQVAEKLLQFNDEYRAGVIPDLREQFDLRLFNMLRCQLFNQLFPFDMTRHADPRGSFFECVRARNSGQTSFSSTVPGVIRGNHFHFDKVERFIVVSGKARISVRRLTDDMSWHFDVEGDKPCFVDMPTLHTHNITNTGDSELLTLFWSNDFFDAENPDTYAEAV